MDNKIKVGGQAVIEGVMMRSPKSLSIAVRKPNGKIIVKNDVWISISEKLKFLKKPFFRGVIVLIESLINGIQALTFSANQALDEEEIKNGEDGIKNGNGVRKKVKKKEEKIHPFAMAMTIIFALGFGMLLFVVLPHYLTDVMSSMSKESFSVETYKFHMIDGVIKITVFVLYILAISLFKDIKRVFMYHGAEHKSIFAHEAGDELTVENARKYSTLHPRCGTSFIMVVLLISIFIFSLIFPMLPKLPMLPKYLRNLVYVFIKIPLMMPIAGISYEVIKLAGKKRNNNLLKLVCLPGMLMQKITTREPTDDQLEVALTALKAALVTEKAAKEQEELIKQRREKAAHAKVALEV